MNKVLMLIIVFCLFTMTNYCSGPNKVNDTKEETVVDHFGRLKVSGRNILDKNDSLVVLRGMSLFWSQWGAAYYNKETVRWLRDDWKCTVIRAAIGIENDGYLENKQRELNNLYEVIDACIELGIYIIVDWHDHHAEDHQNEAAAFFSTISEKYGDQPNIIYEIYNEPLNVSWANVLKSYSESVISEIRKNDPDNIIIAGTPNWSQDVDDIIGNRIDDINTAYSFHFYSGTHKQSFRDKALQAISAGIPLFVSEWGMSEADGNGTIDISENYCWINFLEQNNLSWCNWSIVNKDETSAALLSSTSALNGWSENELSDSGIIVRNYLIKMNSEIFDMLDQQ